MYVLTVWQPYASLIADGVKPVENRSWRLPARALNKPCVIHAGTSTEYLDDHTLMEQIRKLAPGLAASAALPLGKGLAVVRFTACVPVAQRPDCPWSSGPWCFVAELLGKVEHFPLRGKPGLFFVPDHMLPAEVAAFNR